jgi:hypothetical protein
MLHVELAPLMHPADMFKFFRKNSTRQRSSHIHVGILNLVAFLRANLSEVIQVENRHSSIFVPLLLECFTACM